MADITLYAQKINHGQSEIWTVRDGEEASSRKRIASNEVRNVTRRLSAPEVFTEFYAEYSAAIGRIARLTGPGIDEIVTELMGSVV